MGPLVIKLMFSRMAGAAPVLARPMVRAVARAAEKTFYGPQIERHIAWWEAELSKSAWFAGEASTDETDRANIAHVGTLDGAA